MDKKLNNTSKQEYVTPMLDVAELEKCDVLKTSDNGEVEANRFAAPGPGDLFDAVFGSN